MRSTLLLLFLFSRAVAQTITPDTPIVPGQVNLLYLDHLVKEGIDSVREGKGLQPLLNDSVLFVAAQDHADYLNKNNLLTHFESDIPEKYAPADRVRFHGGNDFIMVGENAQTNFALTTMKNKYTGKLYSNNTYGELAFDIVDGWVHSPPHYRNILTAEYELTGVAVSYNPADNSIKAVQVFGKRSGYSQQKEDSTLFPYSAYVPPPVVSSFDQVSHTPHSVKHAWNLRAPKDSASVCPDCWSDEFSMGSTRMEVKNGKAVFYTEDTELMKRLINNRRDGLAVEIVSYKPYDCGNPQYYQNASRRNGQCIFSGKVLKPKYRRQLKKGFKKKKRHSLRERMQDAKFKMKESGNAKGKMRALHDAFVLPFDAEYYTIDLGKIPPGLVDGYYEVNLVIIQKKQVCRVQHFSSFCGDEWNVHYNYPVPVEFSRDTFKLASKEKTYQFNVPFEKGKVDYQYKDVKPFLDSLGLSKFTILETQIDAFASVEGSEEINRSLQQQRASSLVKAMQEVQKDSIQTIIHASENWTLFEEQQKKLPEFAAFRGKTHAEIKTMLQDTTLAHKLEPFLAKERTAHITLKVRLDFALQSTCAWLKEHFQRYTDSASLAKKTGDRPLFLDSLRDLQTWYYRGILAGTADTSCLRGLTFPAKPPFDTIAYVQAWMVRNLLPVQDTIAADRRFYAVCSEIVSAKSSYWPVQYAMTTLEVHYWTAGEFWAENPKNTWAQIAALGARVPDSLQMKLENLSLEWNYRAVSWYEKKGKRAKPDKIAALADICVYWMDSTRASDSIALKLCNYLIEHQEPAWGLMVLQPYALQPQPRHDVLMQYLKLMYRHPEEARDFEDYYKLVAWSKTYLTQEEWCSIFVGPCNISFQLWDSEGMRNMYCDECGSYKNYAKDLSKWEKKK